MRRSFFMWVTLMALLTNCAAAEKSVVSAADVVNEVAHRGDQLYQVSVDACHDAETRAAELPSVATAERVVRALRARCNQAFEALERLRQLVDRLDELLVMVEERKIPIKDLVAAALEARTQFETASDIHAELGKYLEAPK